MSKRRRTLPVSREDGLRLIDNTFHELRHTGTMVALGFLIAAAVLATGDGMQEKRWLLSASMIASVIASACLSAAAWYLIMQSAKKILPKEAQAKIDYADAMGGSGALVRVGFWAVAVAVGALVSFLAFNI